MLCICRACPGRSLAFPRIWFPFESPRIFPTRPCRLQRWKLDWLALTARLASVMVVRATHVNVQVRGSYVRDHCRVLRAVRIRNVRVYACASAFARGREIPREMQARWIVVRQIERDEERRQPADTIVTGCINPPSWYPQGRASNPKVNALDSHRPPSALLLRFVVDFFFWTLPPFPLRLPHTSFFLSRFHRRARWYHVPLTLAHEWDGESHLATSGMSLPLIPPIRPWPESVGPRAVFLIFFFSLSLSLPPSYPPSLSIFYFFFFYSFDLTTSASRTEW